MRAAEVKRKYALTKTSLVVQTKEYFINSTLHGVKYIAEAERPFFDRFLWWACTSVGATVTLIIIVSLWEKFQTNPTITGLDTDFHNWDVEFPAVSLCPTDPFNYTFQLNEKYIAVNLHRSPYWNEYMQAMAGFNSRNLYFKKFRTIEMALGPESPIAAPMREIAYDAVTRCESLLFNCTFKDEPIDCCEYFHPIFTEVGFCYTFNTHPSQGVFGNNKETITDFKQEYIYETDVKWSLEFNSMGVETNPLNVYLHSAHEQPGLDLDVHLVWDRRIMKLAFSAKTTYTMEDARQLSIKQRRCVFPDELHLSTDDIYTYGACLRECRMKLSHRLCGCIPIYYVPANDYHHCNITEMGCLSEIVDQLNSKTICQCELGCDNTIYEVEKLSEVPRNYDGVDVSESLPQSLEIYFVSWPMVRYKREVLFGWVDLLVSFGGIAGLFLGFSLLSGVEIIYYFTVRACCMVVRERATLEEIAEKRKREEKPPVDLSFTPFFMRKEEPDPPMYLHRVKPLHF